MIDIKDKVDREENEQLRSIPAQRLIEKLSLLKNKIEEAKNAGFGSCCKMQVTTTSLSM